MSVQLEYISLLQDKKLLIIKEEERLIMIVAYISEFEYHFSDIDYMEYMFLDTWDSYGKWFPILLEFRREK